ncbi:hypothetical protein BJY00DRAFT_79834 [Aspergillus carlsbadensis]|nr:hypothetical protein BJY00DRAFT_79834 [Aspergillus carlsbadensis]
MTADIHGLPCPDRVQTLQVDFRVSGKRAQIRPICSIRANLAPAEVAQAQRSSSISTTNERADVYLERHSAPALCDPWPGLSYKMIRGLPPRSCRGVLTTVSRSLSAQSSNRSRLMQILHREIPARTTFWTGTWTPWIAVGLALARIISGQHGDCSESAGRFFLFLAETSGALAIYPYLVSAVSVLLST